MLLSCEDNVRRAVVHIDENISTIPQYSKISTDDIFYTVMPPSSISNGCKGSDTQTADGCLTERVKERNRRDDDTFTDGCPLWERWPRKIGVFLREFSVGNLMKPHQAPAQLYQALPQVQVWSMWKFPENVQAQMEKNKTCRRLTFRFDCFLTALTPHSSGFCSPRSALVSSFPFFFGFVFCFATWSEWTDCSCPQSSDLWVIVVCFNVWVCMMHYKLRRLCYWMRNVLLISFEI